MKYLIGTLVVLCALLGLFGWGAYKDARLARVELGKAKDALVLSEQARKRNDDIIATREKELSKLRQRAATQQKDLTHALQAAPEWSGTRIPDGVFDALSDP